MKHLAEIHADECWATLSISCQVHVSDALNHGRDVFVIAPVVAQKRFFDLPPHDDSSTSNRCDSAVTNCLCSTSSLSAWVVAKPDYFAGHLIVSDCGWTKGERRVSPVTHPEFMNSSSEGQSDASI